jgi:tetratricopeptide (TPR) repeat protein
VAIGFVFALALATAARPSPAQTLGDSTVTILQEALRENAVGTRASMHHAIELWNRALPMLARLGMSHRHGVIYNHLGIAYDMLGWPDSALVYLRLGLASPREPGDRANEAELLANIGIQIKNLGRPDSALAYYRQALAIQRELRAREGEAASLQNIGSAYNALGRQDSALAYYRQTLPIQREVGNRKGEALTLFGIAEVHDGSGQADSALANNRRALSIAHEIGARALEGTILHGIGAVHYGLGRSDSAFIYYQRALALEREAGDRVAAGKTLYAIGLIYNRARRLDSALVYFAQALTVAREAGNRAFEGSALHAIGIVHSSMGRVDSALFYVRQALAIERTVGDRVNEGRTLGNIGNMHGMMGRVDSTFVYYRQALAISREVADPDTEAATLQSIGLSYRMLTPPNLGASVTYYDSSAGVRASIAARSGGEANSVSYAEQQANLFESWTLAWLAREPELGRGTSALAALAAAERGRAQALLELMRRSAPNAAAGGDLVAEGRRLLTRATTGGAAVLSYMVTADTLVIWLAMPGQDVEVTRRPVPRDTLAEWVRSLRDALGVTEASQDRVALRGGGSPDANAPARTRGLTSPSGNAASLKAVGRALSGTLLPADFERRLGSTREVVIIPHGVVALVPFAALPVDSAGTSLGAGRALRYAPSLAVLGEVGARAAHSVRAPRPATWRPLVVGNPTMPTTSSGGDEFRLDPLSGAEAEARSVAAQLGAVALTGAKATESEVRARLPAAAVVHLATHGYAYAFEAGARRSFIALAPNAANDGFFTVGEMLDDPALTLSAELVVLSACQTGLGDLRQAEGTVGLQRAFLARGARSVLVSLWSVSDEATALLMKGFYTHWLTDADHPSKAESLRRAQAAVRARPEFRDPKYWAAFQLVGAG